MRVHYTLDELIKKEEILAARAKTDETAFAGSHDQIVAMLKELKSLKESDQSKLFNEGFNAAITHCCNIVADNLNEQHLVYKKIQQLKR